MKKILAIAIALLALPAGNARAALPTIYVNYTLNCTFSITDDSGKPVTSIAPGSYQIAVSSPTSFGGYGTPGSLQGCGGYVQFSFTGPGVNYSTTLDEGDGAYDLSTITLKPSSSYTAVDANNPGPTRTTISTTSGGSPTTPTSSG
ncbi:MAG: hypothetical protein JO368_09165, partial [Acidimicrobiales bacterium]|nr:hypothetical protein [Acidimicrobiales bacterium]